jgi:predicted ferric reductase
VSADDNEFKLILYVSFPNRDSSIALDFFENMQAHCKQFGYTNFELVVRLSQEDSKRRWDIDFIKEIAVGTKGLQKMWVCGPPNLTETFEKAFCQLQEDNVVTRSQVDVL